MSSLGVFGVVIYGTASLGSADGVLSLSLMADSSFFVGSAMHCSVESKFITDSFVGITMSESIFVIGWEVVRENNMDDDRR